MQAGKWYIVAFLGLFLLVAGIIFQTAGPEGDGGWLGMIVRSGVAPIQRVVSGATDYMTSVVREIGSLRASREENRQLRSEVERMQARLQTVDILTRENALLRELLGLRQRSPYQLEVAEVIARNPGNWFQRVTISKGSRSGLREGLPVVTIDGVVGQVQGVTAFASDVLLLTDQGSAIGGMIQDSGHLVLVQGTGDPTGQVLRVDPLVQEARIEVGDTIVTSGLSRIYPKGLPIGVIESVMDEAYGRVRHGELRPFVDFGRLEWVGVVMNPGTDGPQFVESEPNDGGAMPADANDSPAGEEGGP